jgi:hypothetical protein
MDMVRATEYDLIREQIWLRAVEDPGLNLTQKQLASMVGLSQGQLSRRLARARRERPEPGSLGSIELVSPDGQVFGCVDHLIIESGSMRVCLNCGLGLEHIPQFRDVRPLPADKKPPAPGARKKHLRQATRSLSVAVVMLMVTSANAGSIPADLTHAVPFSGVLTDGVAFNGTFSVTNLVTRDYEPVASYTVDAGSLSFGSEMDGLGSSGIFPNPFAHKAEVLLTTSAETPSLAIWLPMPGGSIDFESELPMLPQSNYTGSRHTIPVKTGQAGGVPEPSTWIMTTIAGVLLAARRFARLAGAR